MKNSTRRFLSLLISALLIFGAGAMYMMFVQPVYDEIGTLRAQLADRQTNLQTRTDAAAQLKKLLDQYGGKQQAFDQMTLALPESPDTAVLLAQLQGAAVASKISLASLEYSQQSTLQSSQGAQNKNSTLQPIGTVGFQVTATGTYDGVLQFISSLEQSTRLMDIKSLSLTPENANFLNGDMRMDARVSAYYQKPPESPAANK